MRHEACNGLYKLSLSGLEGGESINRSFLLLAASTLLKFLPDAQALKPLRVGTAHTHTCAYRPMHIHTSTILLYCILTKTNVFVVGYSIPRSSHTCLMLVKGFCS